MHVKDILDAYKHMLHLYNF